MPYYNRDPKRDHNFDNHPNVAEFTAYLLRPRGPLWGSEDKRREHPEATQVSKLGKAQNKGTNGEQRFKIAKAPNVCHPRILKPWTCVHVFNVLWNPARNLQARILKHQKVRSESLAILGNTSKDKRQNPNSHTLCVNSFEGFLPGRVWLALAISATIATEPWRRAFQVWDLGL